MKKMIKNFYNNHPYISIIIIGVVASIFGIAFEWILNKDFIGSGFYSTIALTTVWLLLERGKTKRK
jgi:hypothetical protein